ncbi:MAG TPA: hypothetical protein VFI31_23340 [Pirellulales bacterium]|nr:hypothetical protein [Pirellulales bacterium]
MGRNLWSAAIYRRFELRRSRFLLMRWPAHQQPPRRKKGRSATDKSGDKSPHSKGWCRRCGYP